MRKNFENKLDQLNENLVEMTRMIKRGITLAIASLTEEREGVLEEVQALEKEVDNYSSIVEKQCLMLLLKETPVAGDFRFVSAAMRMNTDLERLGDQAEDIAMLADMMLKAGFHKQELGSLVTMSETSQRMLTLAIQAFLDGDATMARQAAEMDDEVDALFVKVRDELIEDIRTEEVEPGMIVDLIMVAKYLERCGDHAQNIAEAVLYSITGEYAKFD